MSTDSITATLDGSAAHERAHSRTFFRSTAALAILAASLLAWLPFLHQAFTVDDTNFLALAAHAWPHPLQLYNFQINWLGYDQSAFEILANPPAIPWYLALVNVVARGREAIFHLSYWPFFVMLLAGAYRLGRRFVPAQDPAWTVLWVAVSPGLIIVAHNLMPDLPLLACYVLGVAIAIDGFDEKREGLAIGGGLLAGASAMCRYSGMTVFPLLALYALLNRTRLRTATLAIAAGVAPLAVWTYASRAIYGRIHWLTIAGFEATSLDVKYILEKLIYQLTSLSLAMIIGPLLLMLFNRDMRRKIWRGAIAGLIAAPVLALIPWFSRKLPIRAGVMLALGLAGAGMLAVLIKDAVIGFKRLRVTSAEADAIFLACWICGTLAFNLSLRFASVRYIMPALVPMVLLVERAFPRTGISKQAIATAAAISLALAMLLAVSDQQLADAYRDYAASLPAVAQTRWFTGHWGLQYYLGKEGAKPISMTSPVRAGDELITSTVPWPQYFSSHLRLDRLQSVGIDGLAGLRTVTYDGAGCFYNDGVSWWPLDPQIAWIPFGISRAPLDYFTRWRVVAVTP